VLHMVSVEEVPYLPETIEEIREETSQQKVTVEYVHVHKGGQAIVGLIENDGGRGHTKSLRTTPGNCQCTKPKNR
jgi:hypothetical protein